MTAALPYLRDGLAIFGAVCAVSLAGLLFVAYRDDLYAWIVRMSRKIGDHFQPDYDPFT